MISPHLSSFLCRALSDGWWAVERALTLWAAAAIIYKCGDNEASMLMWRRGRGRGQGGGGFVRSSAVRVKAKRHRDALTNRQAPPRGFLPLGKTYGLHCVCLRKRQWSRLSEMSWQPINRYFQPQLFAYDSSSLYAEAASIRFQAVYWIISIWKCFRRTCDVQNILFPFHI